VLVKLGAILTTITIPTSTVQFKRECERCLKSLIYRKYEVLNKILQTFGKKLFAGSKISLLLLALNIWQIVSTSKVKLK
jgi:hypothetical protein